MIYFTGDTHGDFSRFYRKSFPEQEELTASDYVIICGDFGGIWSGDETEGNKLDLLNSRTFTTLFVDGNHENHELLGQYPVTTWNGGKVHVIRDRIIHLMRGQTYNIEGHTFFAMGGASSHDISDGILDPNDPLFNQKRKALDRRNALYRINRRSWWAEELPNDQENAEARANLERVNWRVDYIVSHCAPGSISDIISWGNFQHDRLTEFFEEIKERCNFKLWLFGHYHDNRLLERRFVLLYKVIVSQSELLDFQTDAEN